MSTTNRSSSPGSNSGGLKASITMPAEAAHIEKEQLWKARYSLLREFIDYMTPLYQVLRGTEDGAPQGKQHYLAVPPDDTLRGGAASTTGRVSHSTVRAHVISRSRADGSVRTMLGSKVELLLNSQEPEEEAAQNDSVGSNSAPSTSERAFPGSSSSTHFEGSRGTPFSETEAKPMIKPSTSTSSVDLFAGYGSISVSHSSGEKNIAEIVGIEKLRGGSRSGGCLVILFVSGPLSPAPPEDASANPHASAALMTAGGTGVRKSVSQAMMCQPPWQRHSCFGTRRPVDDDSDSFRTILEQLAVEGCDEYTAATLAAATSDKVSNNTSDYQTPPRGTSSSPPPPPPNMEVSSSSAVVYKDVVVQNCNNAMTHIDAELAMFCSSYVCVPGFEEYIVAKVNQITEGGIERFEDTTHVFPPSSTSTAGAAGPIEGSCINGDESEAMLHPQQSNVVADLTDNSGFVNELWDDDQHEEIIVGFHTIVTAGVSEIVLRHWEQTNEVEDVAFHHACTSLARRLSVSDFSPTGSHDGDLELCDFEDAIDTMVLLDTRNGLSVFSYMRLMEGIINMVVDATTAVISDVTADVCIPLVVFVIVSAAPKRLPTILKFLMDFMIPILEMSSLGYSYTTFEAAAAQVMEEYICRVQNKA